MAFRVSHFGLAEEGLPSGWKADRLDTLAVLNPEQIGDGYPHSEIVYLDIANVAAGMVGEPVRLLLADAPSRAKRLAKANDSILSTVRPGNRAYAFLQNVPENLIVSTGFAVLRARPRAADPRFVYYIATSDPLIDYLASIAEEKTAYPSVNPTDIAECVVPIPLLPEQRAIAHILGTLDDKIELNQRMNETLEAMARALFKSWFVDFDPVRAKAEGRDPGLPKPIADLFPDRFENSELGRIPMGWNVGPLLEQAQLLSGGTPKTDQPEYWNGSIPWASAKDISRCGKCFLISTERTITKLGLQESATQIIQALSTVVVARGATTGRMTMFGADIAMNQTCYALRSSLGCSFALYCQARQVMDDLVQTAHGSVFDTITTSTFQASKVVLPPRDALHRFERTSEPLFRQILAKEYESESLAAIRDALLPKLLCGELRVKDAERFVVEAGA